MAIAAFTLSDVLAFARSKPADEPYNYICNQCALGQFFAARGESGWGPFETWGDATRHIDGEYDGPFAEALAAKTFGELAGRLEALAAEQVMA